MLEKYLALIRNVSTVATEVVLRSGEQPHLIVDDFVS
jgi:hypothetical protein